MGNSPKYQEENFFQFIHTWLIPWMKWEMFSIDIFNSFSHKNHWIQLRQPLETKSFNYYLYMINFDFYNRKRIERFEGTISFLHSFKPNFKSIRSKNWIKWTKNDNLYLFSFVHNQPLWVPLKLFFALDRTD